MDLQLPSKVDEFAQAGIAGEIERDLAGERRQRAAETVVADHLRWTVTVGRDAHPREEALIGQVGHRHQRLRTAQLGEAKHQGVVDARSRCGEPGQHAESTDFPGITATGKAALGELRENRFGEIGIVGADGAEAADQLRTEKQETVLRIPDVELVTLDISCRGQNPAAMIDEQPLPQPEQRLNMRRMALLGRDERMVFPR